MKLRNPQVGDKCLFITQSHGKFINRISRISGSRSNLLVVETPVFSNLGTALYDKFYLNEASEIAFIHSKLVKLLYNTGKLEDVTKN